MVPLTFEADGFGPKKDQNLKDREQQGQRHEVPSTEAVKPNQALQSRPAGARTGLPASSFAAANAPAGKPAAERMRWASRGRI